MQDEVGQLAFTFWLPEEPEPKDETGATQVAVPEASLQPAAARSKPPRKRKWHSLIDKVYALRNLQSAWERVRANLGAPGSDGMTVAKFTERAEERLQQLAQELRGKSYRPQPVRRVFIPKSGGGQRPLGIPTVRDRIVQQALRQVLEPIFEGKFSQRSHGFRPGRGCASARDVVAAGYGLVRYADDFVIFAKSEGEAVAARKLAQEILEGEWGLRLHPEKTRVVSVTDGFEFLGFHYDRDPRNGALRKEVRRKSVQRFREAIRQRTPRLTNQRLPKARSLTRNRLKKNRRLEEMLRQVNAFLRGWHWYFKGVWSAYPDYFGRFDGFVRRRIRTGLTGRLGPGWWLERLPNALLGELGLMSVLDLQR